MAPGSSLGANRAHSGKGKINVRLCFFGGFDPDEWGLPPKPKLGVQS
jgi:hypothetical protein